MDTAGSLCITDGRREGRVGMVGKDISIVSMRTATFVSLT